MASPLAARQSAIASLMAGSRADYTAPDWRPRLRALQSTWVGLLESADPRASKAIRHRLAHALAFAACSIHTSVAEHERGYAAIRARVTRAIAEDSPYRPHGAYPRLPVASAGVEHGVEWARTVDLDLVRAARPVWALADLIRTSVYGLGAAKAPFAAACAGDPESACIDTHGLVDIIGLTFEDARKRAGQYRRRPDVYRRDCREAFGDRDITYSQWAMFAQLVPEFARTGHDVYFRAVGL